MALSTFQRKLFSICKTGHSKDLQREWGILTEPTLGDTLLISAAKNPSADCLRFLLQLGLDVNQKNDIGQTALHAAVCSGSLENIALVLQTPGLVIDAVDKRGRSACHWAAILDLESVVESLLLAGASTQLKCNGGSSVPFLLMERENKSLTKMKLLLCCQNELKEKDLIKMAIRVPVSNVLLEAALALLPENHNRSACLCEFLVYAIEQGSTSAVSFFLSIGVSPNEYAGSKKKLPIVQAARYGRQEETKALLSKGAKDLMQRGQSAVFAAVIAGNSHILRLLLEDGFSPLSTGVSLVQKAINMGSVDCIPLCVLYCSPAVYLDMKGRTDVPASTQTLLRATGFFEKKEKLPPLLGLCRESIWVAIRANRNTNCIQAVCSLALPEAILNFLFFGVSVDTAKNSFS